MAKGINTTADEGQTPIVTIGCGFDEVAHSLRAEGFDASEDGTGRGTPIVPVAIQAGAVRENPDSGPDGVGALRAADGGSSRDYLAQPYAVRRLTPRECERLQGFPDGWTEIPWRGKPADQCPDGPRYKALGNSMAVNVMRRIGRRIEFVEQILSELEATP
jgi:DNA (cytosine-5)-methyltransferase 1